MTAIDFLVERTLRVSLIIPCFDAEPYIEAAVNSALTQGRPPDEIIVVDDGSNDHSESLARQIGQSVRVVRQAHLGISAARNRGLAESTGDLVAFLDADDLWPPNSLDLRLGILLKDHRLAYAFGGIETFDHETGAMALEGMAGRLPGALLVRREVFDRIGGFDTGLRTGEFIDWVSRADAAGCRSAAVPDIVLRRRIHANNITRDKPSLYQDYLMVLRRKIARGRTPMRI